jgi:hypothetical protein
MTAVQEPRHATRVELPRLYGLEIPDELSAAGAMLFAMTLGGSFELLEFALDWFGNTNLQKSKPRSTRTVAGTRHR